MNEELLPCEVAISVVANPESGNTIVSPSSDRKPSLTKKLSNISDNLNCIINSAVGAALVSSSANTSSIIPSRRSSLVGRNRKKSRRLTLTQVCSEESPISHQYSCSNRPQFPTPIENYIEHRPLESVSSTDDYDHLSVSRTASLISFSSISSSSSSAVSSMSSTSSSPKSSSQRSSTSSPRSSISSSSTHPERKINRIFSILHSMQQTFLQAQPFAAAQNGQQQPQQQEPSSTQQEPQFVVMVPPRSTSVTTVHSDACKSSSVRHQRVHQPSRQHIYGMGRSQDSLVLAGAASVNSHPNHVATTIDRNRRFGSANSWTGSQCSGFTCTTVTTSTDATLSAPLVHAMPYHKDGWYIISILYACLFEVMFNLWLRNRTSLFIAGSSTYAQLVIVVCIVAALSEVVTHNVPFLYFEVFAVSFFKTC